MGFYTVPREGNEAAVEEAELFAARERIKCYDPKYYAILAYIIY